LQTSAASVSLQNNVTFTAKVSGPTVTPAGSISFFDGTTSLGTVKLDTTGTATLTTNALAAGSHSMTAVYAGTVDFAGSLSSALTEVVQDFNFTIGGGTVTVLSAKVQARDTAVYTLQIAPISGTTFSTAVVLTLTGLPPGATYTITPSTIVTGSGTTTVTVTVTTAKQQASAATPSPQDGNGFPRPFLLALCLPLLSARSLRRKLRLQMRTQALMMILLAVLMVTGMTACGSGSGFYAQPSQTYSMTLTGASGALHHSVTLELTVQ
jgi:hypothetical protein